MAQTIREVELLEKKINDAISVISRTFGSEKRVEGEVSYFNEKELATIYRLESTFVSISNQLSSIGREVRSMRSSFLPIELFKNIDGQIQQSLANDLGELESYENAFMRMLGVAQSDAISSGSSEVVDGQRVGDIKYVTKEGSLSSDSYFNIENNILRERNLARRERSVVINNYIYDNSKMSEDDSALFFPKIENLEKDLFSFCYLLFPPVQDSNFSKCINEPEKIIAPAFSNENTRNVNSSKIRPPLIESIIKIRLDRLTGQLSLANLKDSPDSLIEGQVDVGSDETVDPLGENYGPIEALFILRLKSALVGLAQKFVKDREDIIISLRKYKRKITEREQGVGGAGDAATPNEFASFFNPTENFVKQVSNTVTEEVNNIKASEKELYLENQLAIEDAIMALLGDNSEITELKVGTQRTSSVQNAHLMSGLLSVIDIPRSRIRTDLNSLRRKQDENARLVSDPIRKEINEALGVDIGIGNIDIIVFALAMFTMSESDLLNLLSEDEFNRLRQTSYREIVERVSDRGLDSSIEATNRLTELAYAGYKLFQQEILNSKSLDYGDFVTEDDGFSSIA